MVILLCMKNIIPPSKNMLEEVLKSYLFFEDDTCYLRNTVNPLFILNIREMIGYDVKICYFDSNTECPICGEEFNRNGTHPTNINNLENVRKQKYICPKCKHTYYTKLAHMSYNAQFTDSYQFYALKISCIQDISLEKTGEII